MRAHIEQRKAGGFCLTTVQEITSQDTYAHKGKVRLNPANYSITNIVNFFKALEAIGKDQSASLADTFVRFVSQEGAIFKIINHGDIPAAKIDCAVNDAIFVKERFDPTKFELAILYQVFIKIGIPASVLGKKSLQKSLRAEYLYFKRGNRRFCPAKIVAAINRGSCAEKDITAIKELVNMGTLRDRGCSCPEWTEEKPEERPCLQDIVVAAEKMRKKHKIKPGRLFPNLVKYLGIYGPPGKEDKVIEALAADMLAYGAEDLRIEPVLHTPLENNGTGFATGNCSAIVQATAQNLPTILLCAHADSWGGPFTYCGYDRDAEKMINLSDNDPLGFDNRNGIAAIIEVLEIIREEHVPHGKIKVLFTIQEEIGLVGATAACKQGFLNDVDVAITFDSPFRSHRPHTNYIQSHVRQSDPVLEEILRASKNLGLHPAVLYIDTHGADSDVFAKEVECTFDFLNGSENIHSPEENMSVRYYVEQIDWLVESIKCLNRLSEFSVGLAQKNDCRKVAEKMLDVSVRNTQIANGKIFTSTALHVEELAQYCRQLIDAQQLVIVKNLNGAIVAFADFWIMDGTTKDNLHPSCQSWHDFTPEKCTRGDLALLPIVDGFEMKGKVSAFLKKMQKNLLSRHPEIKQFFTSGNRKQVNDPAHEIHK